MKNVIKYKNSIISGKARIGRNVKIGDYTKISEDAIIEDGVMIGDGCKIGFMDTVDEKIRLSQNKLYKDFLLKEKACVIKKGSAIHDNAVILNKVVIGKHSVVGNGAFIRSNCRLGSCVTIGFNAYIGQFVSIGEKSIILNYCVIGSTSKIGKCVFLSPSVMLAENKYMLMRSYGLRKGPVIGDYVRIGCLSTIVSCEVGRFSVIGANSVIAKDVGNGVVYINGSKRKLTAEEKKEYLDSIE